MQAEEFDIQRSYMGTRWDRLYYSEFKNVQDSLEREFLLRHLGNWGIALEVAESAICLEMLLWASI